MNEMNYKQAYENVKLLADIDKKYKPLANRIDNFTDADIYKFANKVAHCNDLIDLIMVLERGSIIW